MKSSRTPRLADLIRKPASPSGEEPPKGTGAAGEAEPKKNDKDGSDAMIWIGVDETRSRTAPARAAAPSPPRPSSPASRPAPQIEPSQPESEARRDYELLEQWLGQLFEQARVGRLECKDIFDDVRAILERPRLLDALFTETFKTRPPGHFFARKSLNVGIYALRLASMLHPGSDSLLDLGAAALLHKIGFARLPEELVMKRGALNRREVAAVREHPHLGAEMILELGEPFSRVAGIVRQAHERIDGSGYPRGLKGNEVWPDALLIGLVVVFEALIQPRPYRERLVPFAAVKEILERERTRFPRPLLREFIASFSVFPPFSYVRLNSKAIARVVDTEPGYPLRPQIEILLDAKGRKLARPQALRLRESPLLYITGPVAEEELPV